MSLYDRGVHIGCASRIKSGETFFEPPIKTSAADFAHNVTDLMTIVKPECVTLDKHLKAIVVWVMPPYRISV